MRSEKNFAALLSHLHLYYSISFISFYSTFLLSARAHSVDFKDHSHSLGAMCSYYMHLSSTFIILRCVCVVWSYTGSLNDCVRCQFLLTPSYYDFIHRWAAKWGVFCMICFFDVRQSKVAHYCVCLCHDWIGTMWTRHACWGLFSGFLAAARHDVCWC